jgi:hypothetical protein
LPLESRISLALIVSMVDIFPIASIVNLWLD